MRSDVVGGGVLDGVPYRKGHTQNSSPQTPQNTLKNTLTPAARAADPFSELQPMRDLHYQGHVVQVFLLPRRAHYLRHTQDARVTELEDRRHDVGLRDV